MRAVDAGLVALSVQIVYYMRATGTRLVFRIGDRCGHEERTAVKVESLGKPERV